MKLPELQYDRPVARMVSPEAAGLEAEVRGIQQTAQTVRSVGAGLTQQLEQQADTTARLEAANVRAQIERERTMMRHQVFREYANGEDDPESLFAGLEERDEAIIDRYTQGLGPRAQQYIAPQVASIRTAYRTGRDAQFYSELTTQRATSALAEQQVAAGDALRIDPYDTAPIERYLESVDSVSTMDPNFRRAAKVGGLQTLLASQLLALEESVDAEGMMAVLESDYYRQAQFTPQQTAGFMTAAKTAAVTAVEDDLQVMQNEMVTGKLTVNAGLSGARQLARTIPGLNPQEREQYQEDLQADLSRRYFTNLIRTGRAEEVLQELTQGTRFDTILDPDDTERLLNSARGAMNTKKDISMTSLRARIEDGIASVAAGNPADPAVDQLFQQTAAMSEYLSDSDAENLELLAAEWEATKAIGSVTQNLPQQSESQLRVAEQTLESQIRDDDPNSFMFRARKKVADQGLKTIREQRQRRMEDPAAAAMEANPDVAQAYRDVVGNIAPLMRGEIEPEDIPAIRESMAAYAVQARAVQRQGFELAGDQVRLLPKNDILTKRLTDGLGRAAPVEQLQALSLLSTIAPADVGNAIANQLSQENPRLATALAFLYDGKLGLAEQQLLGGNARAIADADNPHVNSKILTEQLQRHPAAIALNHLVPKDQAMFRDAILDVYFGYAQTQRERGGMIQPNDSMLERAINDVMGPTIQTNPIDPNWRALSFTINEGGTGRFATEREFRDILTAAKHRPEDALAAINDNKPKAEWSVPGQDFDLESVLAQGRLQAVGDGVYEVYVPQSAVQPGVSTLVSGKVMDQNGRPFRVNMHKLRAFYLEQPAPPAATLPRGLQGGAGASY